MGIWARDDAGYDVAGDEPDGRRRAARCCPRQPTWRSAATELANLHALNFVIVGLLGEGVASSTAFDAQAKGLGEYLLSRVWRG